MRVEAVNAAAVNPDGRWVLYWMIAQRRMRSNFALDRAVGWASELNRPLVVLEALRVDHPWASDRLHAFILQGMADNRSRSQGPRGLYYYPYVEPYAGSGRGLLAALAAEAAVVVTDWFPCFFIPALVRAAAREAPVKLETVDANGLAPLAAADRTHLTAAGFRRFLQKTLPDHFEGGPKWSAFQGVGLPEFTGPPREILDRWPPAADEVLTGRSEHLAGLSIDHDVPPAPVQGGSTAAEERLEDFVDHGLGHYHLEARHPDAEACSGLSPYLHFGHLSAHQVFDRVMAAEGWHPGLVAARASGSRTGWWGVSPGAEAFLDQLITWRELGYHFCHVRRDHDRYESLPDWAKTTLADHADDPRPYIYSMEEFETAQTHDRVWNAAQNQLRRDGRLHNYLRMLWGKKILEWTPSPRDALTTMIHLNNKYALDGRDPNSYSGIFWTLGRHDRPFGPVRPVFGKIRYMSSRNTVKKLRMDGYLKRYGD